MTMLHQHRNDAQPQMKSCVKGFRGCFPDKRFIGSCVMQGLINHARVGTAVPSLPRLWNTINQSIRFEKMLWRQIRQQTANIDDN